MRADHRNLWALQCHRTPRADGTPVRGGATYREAHRAMEIIADDKRLVSFEIVEVNPVIDDHNHTAQLAVELTLLAFGKKIL
jgi:arginase